MAHISQIRDIWATDEEGSHSSSQCSLEWGSQPHVDRFDWDANDATPWLGTSEGDPMRGLSATPNGFAVRTGRLKSRPDTKQCPTQEEKSPLKLAVLA